MEITASDKNFLDVGCSFSGKRWLERSTNYRQAQALSQQFQFPEIIGRFLSARGVLPEFVENFLNPKLNTMLPDPSHFLDMQLGVKRIIRAIQANEKIVIFGDYDVDGATSTALLALYFSAIEVDYKIYIPDRIKEGYGPSITAFQKLKEEGASVIITVDCGTTAFEPLTFANDNGLDIIIVDHHIAEANLPKAVAVINPNRLDEIGQHTQLAAVGVSFLLTVALNRELREVGFFTKNKAVKEPNLLNFLDIVALGTVADMVALTGVNRALVVQGLKVMAKRQNKGLTALVDIAGIDEAPSAYHLGFIIGPRVNAGGRVGESNLGAQLLSTQNAEEAIKIAQKLDGYNLERREIEENVFKEALSLVEKKTKQNDVQSLIFVVGKDWHPGVVGIVASRLKGLYSLPACVLSEQGGLVTGSGRSIKGVDLGACVISARQAGIISNGGGHAMAAGFSLKIEQVDAFEKFLSQRISKQISEGGISPSLIIDASITIEGATMDLVQVLEKMAPFGTGNAEPRLAFSGVRVIKADIVGKDHVRCFLTGIESKKRLSAIAFRCVDTDLGQALLDQNGLPLHIAGRLRANNWQGKSSVQLLIDDAAPIAGH